MKLIQLHERNLELPIYINTDHIVSFIDRSSEQENWRWTIIRTTGGNVEVMENGKEIAAMLNGEEPMADLSKVTLRELEGKYGKRDGTFARLYVALGRLGIVGMNNKWDMTVADLIKIPATSIHSMQGVGKKTVSALKELLEEEFGYHWI